jgi:hypothetical protein
VVATSYLLGVSTRRVEKLAASPGVVGLSKSQVSAMRLSWTSWQPASGPGCWMPGRTRSAGSTR